MKSRFITVCSVSIILCMIPYTGAMGPSEAPASEGEATEAPTAWREKPAPVEDGGLTTTMYDNRGNWYLKQQLLKSAREVYEKIKQIIEPLEQLKKDFFARRSTSDEKVDMFYRVGGFEEGELESILNSLEKQLEDKMQKEGQLTEQERLFMADITEKKKEVEALKKDLSVIHEIEATLDKAMNTIIEQIDACHAYQQQAWENYEKISDVLSDELAEKLLLEIQGFAANCEIISNYLTRDMAAFFDRAINQLESRMESVKKQVDSLRERGVILEKKVASYEESVSEEVKQAEQQKMRELEKKLAEAQQPWYKKWYNAVVNWVQSWFSSFYNLIFGVKEVKKIKKEVKEIKEELQERAKTAQATISEQTRPVLHKLAEEIKEEVKTERSPEISPESAAPSVTVG